LCIVCRLFLWKFKGKKPAKAPAKAPAITTPAIPAVTAAPAAAKGGDTSFNIAIWGGYNLAQKSNYVKNVESIFGDNAGMTGSNDSKIGGIAGGADILYGSNFQIGVSGSYLKGYDITRTLTQSGQTYTLKAKMDYAPVVLLIKYYFVPGLYLGAGAGVAMILNGSEALTTSAGAAVNINTAAQVNVPWNFSYTGSAIAVQGRVGYDLALSSNFTIGAAGIFTYISKEIDGGTADSSGNSLLKTLNGSAVHITPALIATLKF